MITHDFDITDEQLEQLFLNNPNMGKNSHVGNVAVKIVKLFFLSKYPESTFSIGSKGADIEVRFEGRVERFEIKGTADKTISWSKLKVSSKDCHDCLVQGMTLIRVTGVGTVNMKLHFLKYGEDFTLIPEVRYEVRKIKK